MMRVLKALASLRLTVALLALSMALVLAGTLAQVRDGVWTVVDQYFRSAIVVVDLQLFVPESLARVPGAIVMPGGVTLGLALLLNLIAAHAVRFKLRTNRIGIILTHAGVVLLIVGEFVTGLAANEGQMSILEGESSNYTEDIRSSELAVIDRSGSGEDLVVAVPDGKLDKPGVEVRHGLLPFEIRVDAWMPNSRLERAGAATLTSGPQADSGAGRSLIARPMARATGVGGQRVDVPSAVLTLHRSGQVLGRYLVSVHMGQPQQVLVDGRVYDIELRFRRDYKPYRVELIDFRHDKFVGTETPRNFSSLVRLIDPEHGVDREVLIWMNHPLRYRGETFYQQSYRPDNTGTVLQVVRNPGWLIPYVSCIVVTLGMLIHFVGRLKLRRSAS